MDECDAGRYGPPPRDTDAPRRGVKLGAGGVHALRVVCDASPRGPAEAVLRLLRVAWQEAADMAQPPWPQCGKRGAGTAAGCNPPQKPTLKSPSLILCAANSRSRKAKAPGSCQVCGRRSSCSCALLVALCAKCCRFEVGPLPATGSQHVSLRELLGPGRGGSAWPAEAKTQTKRRTRVSADISVSPGPRLTRCRTVHSRLHR